LIIETKYLGEIEISDDKIVHFESGIPGFEDEKKFILLDIADNIIFQILQSVETKELAFFVVNPYILFEDYSIKLNENIIESLDIKEENDVAVLTVMTLKEPFSNSTVNLKAPLIINLKNKRAKQYILNDDTYSMRVTIPQHKLESGAE
jgi:flagellar assembly factor FliW